MNRKKIEINESQIRSMVRESLRRIFNEYRSYDRFGERDDDEDEGQSDGDCSNG